MKKCSGCTMFICMDCNRETYMKSRLGDKKCSTSFDSNKPSKKDNLYKGLK